MLLRTFTRNLNRLNRRLTDFKNRIDYALCIDIECTCDSPLQIYPMELIEISCLKLDVSQRDKTIRPATTREYLDRIDASPKFHSYVRPTIHPELTLFCQDLTGIDQVTVDQAETVDKVLVKLMQWLESEKLVSHDYCKAIDNFAFASCGNFDLKFLNPLFKEHIFAGKLNELPPYLRGWINVKKTFVNHRADWPKNLYHMVELLGEEPLGRLHSAQDDCRNLALTMAHLHSTGCDFYVNHKLIHTTPL